MNEFDELNDLVDQLSERLDAMRRRVLAEPAPLTDLAADVRRLRHEKQLTQEELADLAGVSASTIRRVEAGQTEVGLATVLSILKVLGAKLWIG